MYSLSDYHYDLPETLIAQQPVKGRDGSRLLAMDRDTGTLSHHRFRDIVAFLDPDDLLVVNNTKVIPARLMGKKETGGTVEVLLLNHADGSTRGMNTDRFVCNCLVRASKRPKAGTFLSFGPELRAEVLEFQDGVYNIEFTCDGVFEHGEIRSRTVSDR